MERYFGHVAERSGGDQSTGGDQRGGSGPAGGGRGGQPGGSDHGSGERSGSDRSEGEESSHPGDNSLGRLLTLCDGVFAIAMTLLALDLTVPKLGNNPSDATLRHALADNTSSYLSFLVSFYVIANYWLRHRRLMRFVVVIHARLIRDTIFLLLIVAAMPFLASLLGHYGGTPIALALYGVFNAIAVLTLLQIRRDIAQYGLTPHPDQATGDASWIRDSVRSLGVFLLCIPAGYVLGSHGPWVLVLLAVPTRLPRIGRFGRRRRAPTTASQA